MEIVALVVVKLDILTENKKKIEFNNLSWIGWGTQKKKKVAKF